MSALQAKAKPKSKKGNSHHHFNAGSSSSHVYGPSPAASSQLSAFYSAGPVFGLGTSVQTKLAIGQPNDPYEREADAVADRVTAGGQAPPISLIPTGVLGGVAQRQMKDQEEPAEPPTPHQLLQRQTQDEERLEESVPLPQLLQRQVMDEEKPEEPQGPVQFLQRQTEDEKDPEEQLLTDLHWLIADGYVVEFSNGRLWAQPEKPPAKPTKSEKPKPKAEPEQKPAATEPAKESVPADEEPESPAAPPS